MIGIFLNAIMTIHTFAINININRECMYCHDCNKYWASITDQDLMTLIAHRFPELKFLAIKCNHMSVCKNGICYKDNNGMEDNRLNLKLLPITIL
uniref:Uncharacterized protein n=1 Tax=viral metagenome TaxID=1070528 RepID=A0A6C0J601_9ZZZZ